MPLSLSMAQALSKMLEIIEGTIDAQACARSDEVYFKCLEDGVMENTAQLVGSVAQDAEQTIAEAELAARMTARLPCPSLEVLVKAFSGR